MEGHREPRLPLLEQVLEAPVAVRRRAETGELPHGPELGAVALGEEAPGVWEGARGGQLLVDVGQGGRDLPGSAGAIGGVEDEPGDGDGMRVDAFGAEALVVSLGVDTFKGDPISFFTLEIGDFPKIGARIAAPGLPTVFAMEGGYAVAEIGVNAVGVLQGFEAASATG